MNKNFGHLCFKNGCNIPFISEPVIKKHGIHSLTGTYFSFSALTLKSCCSTFSLSHAHLFLPIQVLSIPYSFWRCCGKLRENPAISHCRFKPANTYATLPGFSQDSSKKFISVFILWRKAKGSTNIISCASMSTGYNMYSTDQKIKTKLR